MSSLRTLLRQPRDPATPVALRRSLGRSGPLETVPWSTFRRDVEALRGKLTGSGAGWLLFCDDAYAFAVGLFALWHEGHHALLPPNRQTQTLASLEERAAGTLTDCSKWIGAKRGLDPLAASALRGDALATSIGWAALAPEALAVELFTSGTTGTSKPVTKQLRHLDEEVTELATSWDALIGSATVFSTASPQHLYGLLFGVLWPLQAGRPFCAEQFLHPDELVTPMLESGRSVLASVPTTLRRLVRHRRVDELRDCCRVVFSSGGPLALDTARGIAAKVGRAPLEVLGSTETGGIAWRQQQAPGSPAEWTPFPSVRIQRDEESGELRVRSPFVSVACDQTGYRTGDRIVLRDAGRFAMEGRSDDVVKVGEKRLDLEQMAAVLRTSGDVEDVALVTLERDGNTRIAAVVVPSPGGRARVEREGRFAFQRELRARLRPHFDPVLYPRYWRTVPELPASSQGKLPREALRALFLEASVTASDRPEVLDEETGSDFVERSCRVPADLSCFLGHFPSRPVVPGVLQLDWAMELAEQVLGHPPRIAEVESLKLAAPLTPGQRFRLRTRVDSSGTVEFRLWTRDVTCALGRVRLDTADSAR